MNKELEKYIEEKIIPLYTRNDDAHGIEHIKTVIRRSLELAKNYDVNIDMVYTIAAYHDFGVYIDRKTHEIISADMFMKDENMKKWFSDEQRIIMKEAIEDHRASCNHEPRSIYGKIVSAADRMIATVDSRIKRACISSLRLHPEFTREEHISRVYNHLSEKFGENGYAKMYIEDKEYDASIAKFRQALSDKEGFIKKIEAIMDQIL